MNGENAPEFHDRLSIHPESVQWCREALMRTAWSSGILGAEDEVDALTDWEAVRMVESAYRTCWTLTRGLQGVARAMQGTGARFAELNEALMPLAAEATAVELETFLTVDHSV